MDKAMNWEQLFQQWKVARDAPESHKPPYRNPASEALEEEARSVLQSYPIPKIDWLLSALEGATEEDERKRDFLGMALRPARKIPWTLFNPLLRAAVYDRHPSSNRSFIEACLRWAGRRRVNEELLRYLATGTNREKAGAVSAMYWSLMDFDGVKDENINDLIRRMRCLFLTEFVSNEDVQVRRQIVSMLLVEPRMYPMELYPLVPKAIQIAREHEDAYIRHRIEIQLGGTGPYLPIPT